MILEKSCFHSYRLTISQKVNSLNNVLFIDTNIAFVFENLKHNYRIYISIQYIVDTRSCTIYDAFLLNLLDVH